MTFKQLVFALQTAYPQFISLKSLSCFLGAVGRTGFLFFFKWLKNICFMCWRCSVFRLRHKSKDLFMFIFVFLVPFLCRWLLPSVLQIVQVHFFALYTIHLGLSSPPLHLAPLSLFLFYFAVFSCAVYSRGLWSAGLHMWPSSHKSS